MGELREGVRGQRRNDEEVGSRQMRVQILRRRAPCEGEEGLRTDEALGPGGDERDDLVPALDEQPDELTRLVGGDSPCDTHEHAGHTRILPAYFEYLYLSLPSETSSRAMVR